MTKHQRPALEDILRSIEWIEKDTKGKTFDSFARDRQARQLVERNVEIVSEASRRIPGAMKADFPGIPWKAIAGVGNVLRHDYEEVAPKVLWDVVREDLKPLKAAVQKMLRGLADRRP
jgi:uncharacterized protein with HEPN domain